MSKKYRCPHCGEEIFSFADLIFNVGAIRSYNSSYSSQDLVGLKGILKCSECGKKIGIADRKTTVVDILTPILFTAAIILMIVAMIKWPWLILLCIPLTILICALYNAFTYRFERVFVPVEYDKRYRFPNAKIKFKTNRKILDYDILGVRFNNKSNSVRYNETFRGIVPAVFYKDGSMHLLKRQFIPDDILCVGSKFDILWAGEVVGKGIISQVFDEKEPTYIDFRENSKLSGVLLFLEWLVCGIIAIICMIIGLI